MLETDPGMQNQNQSKNDKAYENVAGEGDHEAGRRYQEQTERFREEGKVEPAAREAKEAVEGPEGTELENARRETKAVADYPEV